MPAQQAEAPPGVESSTQRGQNSGKTWLFYMYPGRALVFTGHMPPRGGFQVPSNACLAGTSCVGGGRHRLKKKPENDDILTNLMLKRPLPSAGKFFDAFSEIFRQMMPHFSYFRQRGGGVSQRPPPSATLL